MGLFDSVLPAVFSAGNQIKKNLRGLLDDPKGQTNTIARSVSDTLQGLLGPLAGIQAETARGQGVLGSDPALQKAARDQQIAAVSNFLAPMATVWHGSPHKFSKFDSSKIGTGEGAQAYGHGLYFAEKPETAQAYQRQLSIKDPLEGMVRNMYENRLAAKLPHEKAVAQTKEWAKDHAQLGPNVADKVDGILGRGNLYKVDIPDDAMSSMMDWNLPLNQQPQKVVDLIRQKLKEQKYLGPQDNGPRQLESALRAWKIEHGGMSETAIESLIGGRGGLLGDTPEQVASALNKAGVPGIRYLDQGSRSAGYGTKNLVVFPGNEGLLTILERNGKPLLGD